MDMNYLLFLAGKARKFSSPDTKAGSSCPCRSAWVLVLLSSPAASQCQSAPCQERLVSGIAPRKQRVTLEHRHSEFWYWSFQKSALYFLPVSSSCLMPFFFLCLSLLLLSLMLSMNQFNCLCDGKFSLHGFLSPAFARCTSLSLSACPYRKFLLPSSRSLHLHLHNRSVPEHLSLQTAPVH